MIVDSDAVIIEKTDLRALYPFSSNGTNLHSYSASHSLITDVDTVKN